MGLTATMQDFALEAERAARKQGRDVRATVLAERDAVQFYDCEYGMMLGRVDGPTLRHALGRGGEKAFWAEMQAALREPTSLEILAFAQLTGPHVRGVHG